MGLSEDVLNDHVSELSLRRLVVAAPQTAVRDVCAMMRDARLGAAMILDDDGQPVGMFNEKLLIRMLHENTAALEEPVENHMTRNLRCVRETDTVAHLITVMQEHKLRWICVVDDTGRATALTGLRGAMEYIVDHFSRHVHTNPLRSRLSMEQREGA